jgi:hypothetical protein
MRKSTLLTVLLVFVVCAAVVADDVKWFDMKGCAFCKNLTKDPKLMENMSWENHDISNGNVTITTVKPDYKPAYLEAQKAMMELGMKMEKGELKPDEVPMCGHCQNYGKLMEAGAKFEYVPGEAAEVVIIWSDNPEVVKQIKEFGKRNRDEWAKMEAMEDTEHE